MGKSAIKFGLENYVSQSPLKQYLCLSRDANLHFHWSNWENTVEIMRAEVFEDPLQRKLELDQQLKRYKDIPVWIYSKLETKQSNLYDVYMAYLDPRLRQVWFLDPDSEIQISLHNNSGPFMHIGSLRWLNPNIARDFVHKKIFDECILQRKFRLHWPIEAKCYSGVNEENQIPIKLNQVTGGGLLFKIRGGENLNRLLLCEDIRIDLPVRPIEQLMQQNIPKFKNCLQETPFTRERDWLQFKVFLHQGLKDEGIGSYRISELKEHFLFIPYECMIGLDNSIDLGHLMRSFLDRMESILNHELAS